MLTGSKETWLARSWMPGGMITSTSVEFSETDAEPDVVRVDLETEEVVDVESKREVVDVLRIDVLRLVTLEDDALQEDALDVETPVCCTLLVDGDPPLGVGMNER